MINIYEHTYLMSRHGIIKYYFIRWATLLRGAPKKELASVYHGGLAACSIGLRVFPDEATDRTLCPMPLLINSCIGIFTQYDDLKAASDGLPLMRVVGSSGCLFLLDDLGWKINVLNHNQIPFRSLTSSTYIPSRLAYLINIISIPRR